MLLCKYYIVISDKLVGFFLNVLFLFCAVILSVLHEKPKRKDWVTEKSTKKYLCDGYHFFDCTLSVLCLFAAFFVYSLSLPKWHTCGMAAIKIHILLWVAFCVIISWVNSRKYENLYINTIHFFYKQRFFSTHPRWCLAFSWIELQMLLRCCLMHITIIIHFMFYILYIFV